MKSKNGITYGVISLGLGLIVIILCTQLILGFNKTYAEDVFCQFLRNKEKITSDYICTLGQEHVQDNKNLLDVSFSSPHNYFDQKNYTVDKDSKEIISTSSKTN